ncbi:hypothetical protein RRG08_054118 [Elysia crispata]|uniref:Uncharacterized protein n=1 Tax=Elysia crispata TaxID=231223 RepID=A0AAE0XP84_9GAST|nr:hypothetical protein RRG08_054118 [Elysia crispata]
MSNDMNFCRDYAIILLIKAELSLSKVVSEHSALGSPSPSKKASSLSPNMADLFGEFHEMDMSFLEALTGMDDVFSKAWFIPLNLDKFSQYEVLHKKHTAVVDYIEGTSTVLSMKPTPSPAAPYSPSLSPHIRFAARCTIYLEIFTSKTRSKPRQSSFTSWMLLSTQTGWIHGQDLSLPACLNSLKNLTQQS